MNAYEKKNEFGERLVIVSLFSVDGFCLRF